MISSDQPFRMCATPSVDAGQHGTHYFRILDLPRELRDRVYRELLITEKARVKGQQGYSLTPSILRVNKQVHVETSRVLYEENTWIHIISKGEEPKFEGHQSEMSILSLGQLFTFPGNYVLEVNVVTESHSRAPKLTHRIAPISHFRLICLSLMNIEHLDRVRFQLDFHIYQVAEVRRNQIRQLLLESLGIMRRVGRVVVRGILPYPVRSELVSLMESDHLHIDEIFSRMRILQDQGATEVALGRLPLATQFYYYASDYPPDLRDEEHGEIDEWLTDLDGADTARIGDIETRRLSIHLQYMWCLIQSGPGKNRLRAAPYEPGEYGAEFAFGMLENVVKYDDQSEDDIVTAKYYMGLAKVAMGQDLEAVACFGRTLEAEPGHDGANKELDTMLARIQCLPPHKRIIIKGHMDRYCGPYRHAKVEQVDHENLI